MFSVFESDWILFDYFVITLFTITRTHVCVTPRLDICTVRSWTIRTRPLRGCSPSVLSEFPTPMGVPKRAPEVFLSVVFDKFH